MGGLAVLVMLLGSMYAKHDMDKRNAKLKTEGKVIEGKIVSYSDNSPMHLVASLLGSFVGDDNTYTVFCEAEIDGIMKEFIYTTNHFSKKLIGQPVKIYIDKKTIRNYYVDIGGGDV